MWYPFRLLLFVMMFFSVSGGVVKANSIESEHPLEFMFGEWVGTASGLSPDGTSFSHTQTERVGPMLDGDIVVIEGRGYNSEGETVFNAFAVVSNGQEDSMEIRTYANGRSGTYSFLKTADGFEWIIPSGPNTKIRYVATFDEGIWKQVGYRITDGQEPIEFFQMELQRTASSDWPSAGAVEYK